MLALALLQPSSDDSSRRCVQARCVLDWSEPSRLSERSEVLTTLVSTTEVSFDEEVNKEMLEVADDLGRERNVVRLA